MKNIKDTIFAISTPQIKSALAIIRVSGSKSHSLVGGLSSNMPKKPNLATLNEIKTKDGLVVDQTITTFFKAPKSFTGEDVVEVSIHGSLAVIKKITEIFLKTKNVRIASPGEFTRRAFENNKLDLTQVEAIADIVNAETEMQRKQAIGHLSGVFFKKSKNIYNKLKKTLANIEALIDFSDEDLPEKLQIEIKEQIENIINEINEMLSNSSTGISIRSGFVIAVVGKPNTGKSSFINKISGKNVSIVDSLPGTTRDMLESFVDIDGVPFRFFDTAGIRRSSNVVEQKGVELSLQAAKESNLNLVFLKNEKEMAFFKDIKNPIFVKSKQDLRKARFKEGKIHNISSLSGYGIKQLFSIIIKKTSSKIINENIYISRERHVHCLKKTLESLENSRKEKNIDLFAEDLRIATKEISSLFGSIDIEDILDIIFSDFCIGK